MGAYTEIEFTCPVCKDVTTTQSKLGDCSCETVALEEASLLVIADVNDEGINGRLRCEKCGTKLGLVVHFTTAVVARKS